MTVRVPLQPLIDHLRLQPRHEPSSDGQLRLVGVPQQLARLINVADRTVQRGFEHGITLETADTWAIRAGTHPTLVWDVFNSDELDDDAWGTPTPVVVPRETGRGRVCGIVENGVPCSEAHSARGMCDRHYTRWRVHGDPLRNVPPGRRRRQDVVPPRPRPAPVVEPVIAELSGAKLCGVVENGVLCEKPHSSRGLCEKHRYRWLTYGDPLMVRGRRAS